MQYYRARETTSITRRCGSIERPARAAIIVCVFSLPRPERYDVVELLKSFVLLLLWCVCYTRMGPGKSSVCCNSELIGDQWHVRKCSGTRAVQVSRCSVGLFLQKKTFVNETRGLKYEIIFRDVDIYTFTLRKRNWIKNISYRRMYLYDALL